MISRKRRNILVLAVCTGLAGAAVLTAVLVRGVPPQASETTWRASPPQPGDIRMILHGRRDETACEDSLLSASFRCEPSPVPVLKEALEARDWRLIEERTHAALALSYIGGPEAVEALRPYYEQLVDKRIPEQLRQQQWREIRTHYVRALGTLRSEQGRRALLEIVRSPSDEEQDEFLRRRALRALALAHPEAAREAAKSVDFKADVPRIGEPMPLPGTGPQELADELALAILATGLAYPKALEEHGIGSLLELEMASRDMRYWQWRESAWRAVREEDWKRLVAENQTRVDAYLRRTGHDTDQEHVPELALPSHCTLLIDPVRSRPTRTSDGEPVSRYVRRKEDLALCLSHDGSRALVEIVVTGGLRLGRFRDSELRWSVWSCSAIALSREEKRWRVTAFARGGFTFNLQDAAALFLP